MSDLVSWLCANLVRWVVPAVVLVAVLGLVVALLWECWRAPARDRERRQELEGVAWMRQPAGAQAGYDADVLAASDAASRRAAELAAELVVRAEAARVGHLYEEPTESGSV